VRRYILVAAAGMAAFPVSAEPLIFSGVVDTGIGYATDPKLRGDDGGSLFGSISLAPRLTRTTPRTATTLGGVYNREEYLHDYGHTDTASAFITHAVQFTQRLSGNGRIAYNTSNNPLIGRDFDPDQVDPLTIGQRTRRLEGSAGLNWTPTARDSYTASVNASSVEYNQNSLSRLVRDFKQIGGTFGYSRAIDARTQVGVQLTASAVDSEAYPDTTSLQPSLTIHRQIDPRWTFDGHIGLISQHVNGAGSSNSLGYGASLCRDDVRTNGCLSVDRSSSTSGIGGIRRDFQVAFNVNHRLSQRSSVDGLVSYKDSTGQAGVASIAANPVRVLQARGNNRYDLTQRLAVGFGGRYQRRSGSSFGRADSVAVTANLTAKIGRI
jgi:hypothetical protein